MGKAAPRTKSKNLVTVALSDSDFATLRAASVRRGVPGATVIRTALRLYQQLLEAEAKNVNVFLKGPTGDVAQLLCP